MIDRNGGPADITEDVEAQLFLLGGPCPSQYDAEAAMMLKTGYFFRRGVLMIEGVEGYRVYPTAYLRKHIVETYHHTLMHAGWRATAEAIKARYYWPGLDADVKAYC